MVQKDRWYRYFSILNNSAVIVLGYLLFSGLLTAWNFIPLPDRAPLSLEHIRNNTFLGSIMILLHKTCALLFIAALAAGTIVLSLSPRRSGDWFPSWILNALLCTVPLFSILTGLVVSGSITPPPGWIKPASIQSTANPLPLLYDHTPVLFVRFYIVHCFILPVVLVFLAHRHWKARKKAYPVPESPSTSLRMHFIIISIVLAVLLYLFTAVIVRSRHGSPLAGIPDSFFNMVSFTAIPIASLLVFIFLMIVGFLLRSKHT